MQAKRTLLILIAVAVILGGGLVAGGGRLYRRVTAPRVDTEATPVPPTATAVPEPTATPAGTGWREAHDAHSGQRYLTPPDAETRALRAAWAALLHRTRVLDADEAALLAYDLDASIERAQAYVAEDYDWPLLLSQFVFVHAALGPENAVQCTDTTHCRVTQAVLGIRAVLIFDAAMCQALGRVPCLAPLGDDQLDARDNLITADFRRDPGGWRLTAWDVAPLPAPPEGW